MTIPSQFETSVKSLKLTPPWTVSEIVLKESPTNKQELHISLSYPRKSLFEDETGTPCPVHDTYAKTWRHKDYEQYRCYIHCKEPRIKATDGTNRTVLIPWARPNSRFSLAFEENVMQLITPELSLKKLARV